MEGPKFLEAFNFPGGKVTQGRRHTTNVPAQALALMNDPFVVDQAGRWADAQTQLDAMKSGPLHAIARAELYTAKDSPKVDVAPLLDLIAQAQKEDT